MTNSHIPQGLISQQHYATDIFPKCTVVDGGFLSLPLKGMFYIWASATGNVLQRAHLWNWFVCKTSQLNHFAHSDTRILKMADLKGEHWKHRSDDTLDPSHHSAAKSLPEAPAFRTWEEFYFTTNKCPHLAGFLPVYVTSLQYWGPRWWHRSTWGLR